MPLSHADTPSARAPELLELAIVMPCLNEAETLALCVRKAKAFFVDNGIAGEVIVADNGSTDGSQQIANALGARIVHVPSRGYGAALIGGIEAAHGRFIVMGDAGDSYDFGALMPFVTQLRDGAELVMGNRFRGGIASGAMPPLHSYLGNPVLSFLGRAFFGTPVGDFHCGLRAFRRDSVVGLSLSSPGMEFASEMVVKASIAKLDIREVPTILMPDGRSRPPHLRTWRDGWRHLRFPLIYAPRFLFLYPGVALTLGGLTGVLALMPSAIRVGQVEFSIATMIFAAMAVLIGSQLIGLSARAPLWRHIRHVAGKRDDAPAAHLVLAGTHMSDRRWNARHRSRGGGDRRRDVGKCGVRRHEPRRADAHHNPVDAVMLSGRANRRHRFLRRPAGSAETLIRQGPE